MSPEAHNLNALLDDEQAAAKKADLEALVALQPRKQAALDAFMQSGASDEEINALALRARANITLMRQMVQILHGVVNGGQSNATYTAAGATQRTTTGRRRAVV